MHEALVEIMEPKLRVREEKMRIAEAVSALREFGHKDEEIRPAIIKRYNLSMEEAKSYLQEA